MSERPVVFVHAGVPKSGTTFLQRALANNRSALRDAGFLYPGPRVDHFFPALDLMDWDFQGHADPRREGAWPRLVSRLREWETTSLISHEVLAAAKEPAVDRLVADLDFADVHLLLTLRDPARQLVAVWQENVKNRSVVPFPKFFRRTVRAHDNPSAASTGFWPYQDIPGILQRWARHLPRERVHVVTAPAPGSDDSLWARFLRAVDLDPDAYDPGVMPANTSLGVAETALLLRLNARLSPDLPWRDYERTVKFKLANDVLGPRPDRVPISLTQREHAWCQSQAEANRAAVSEYAGHVQGSLDDLMPAPWTPPGAEGRDKPPAEQVLDAALDALAAMVEADKPPPPPPPPAPEQPAPPPPEPPPTVRQRVAARVRRYRS